MDGVCRGLCVCLYRQHPVFTATAKKHHSQLRLWIKLNFELCNSALIKATLLVHPQHDSPNKSVLEQLVESYPIVFFFCKPWRAETWCSAFKLEYFDVYLAIRLFDWLVEGFVFHVYTDRKLLTVAISQSSAQRWVYSGHLSCKGEEQRLFVFSD